MFDNTLINLLIKLNNDCYDNKNHYGIVINKKYDLLNDDIKQLVSKGIDIKDYINFVETHILNIINHDLNINDIVILNIGVKTLQTLITIMIDKDNKSMIFDYDNVNNEFYKMIIRIINNKTLIYLEYSDNEGRIVIRNKNDKLVFRENTKIIKNPLYDIKLL